MQAFATPSSWYLTFRFSSIGSDSILQPSQQPSLDRSSRKAILAKGVRTVSVQARKRA